MPTQVAWRSRVGSAYRAVVFGHAPGVLLPGMNSTIIPDQRVPMTTDVSRNMINTRTTSLANASATLNLTWRQALQLISRRIETQTTVTPCIMPMSSWAGMWQCIT